MSLTFLKGQAFLAIQPGCSPEQVHFLQPGCSHQLIFQCLVLKQQLMWMRTAGSNSAGGTGLQTPGSSSSTGVGTPGLGNTGSTGAGPSSSSASGPPSTGSSGSTIAGNLQSSLEAQLPISVV